MGQTYPFPTCGSKMILIAGWTVEVANTSFLKWCIHVIELWLVSIKSILFRRWDGNPELSFFNFTFGMDEDLMLVRRRKVLNQFVNTALLFPLNFFFFVLTISSARSKVPENTNIRGLIANL